MNVEHNFQPLRNDIHKFLYEKQYIYSRWNSFDGRNTSFRPKEWNAELQPDFDLKEIWHLHFTAMSTQPWHPIYTPWAKGNYRREDIAKLLWQYAKECKMISNPEEF